ncbi:MAG TPA: beta-1,6-glucan synthase, partial [Methylophilaceae bacterium]|nr:beta-1,6-glucan synthase [Methylophilaceae bacterium]
MPPSDNIYSGRSGKLWRYAVFNLVLLALFAAWYYYQNRPVKLAEPQLANGKLECVSYAPYYQQGKSPFVPLTLITHDQIKHDLSLLSQRFQCVRIYSVDQGLDYVPEAASELGLKVLLGAWVGLNPL